MNKIRTILQLIHAYDKWTFNFTTKEFVFYTWFYADETCNLFKPKCWFKSDLQTFIRVMMKKNLRKNFTTNPDEFF